jgi:ribosomal protein S18 acetylase RimI-like enzyme
VPGAQSRPGVIGIRPATAADTDAVRSCVRDAYAHYVPRIGREPAPMKADYAALIESGEVWVATEEERVVGVLVLRARPTSLLLENVAVRPERQGRSIGRVLIAFAEQHAHELGLPEITLYTHGRMTENIRMYRKLGYVETERRAEAGYARVFFRKSIA